MNELAREYTCKIHKTKHTSSKIRVTNNKFAFVVPWQNSTFQKSEGITTA